MGKICIVNKHKKINLSLDTKKVIDYLKFFNTFNLYCVSTRNYIYELIGEFLPVKLCGNNIHIHQYNFELVEKPYSNLCVYLDNKVFIQLPQGYEGDSVYYIIEGVKND